tara:strand:- start:31854 stop:32357 length:504 start_codon:yes stop_codon:yes gene_type:complete
MERNVNEIPANQDEIKLYCYLGEALFKVQIAEQALSHSITLKLNPVETMERAHEILKQHQRYTLGKAIKTSIKEKLYCLSLQDELNDFLEQRNWLVHKVICGIEDDLNTGKIKDELFNKIKSISDKAESIQQKIEYDMIKFCSSKGKDMFKILALLELQEQGIRIRK